MLSIKNNFPTMIGPPPIARSVDSKQHAQQRSVNALWIVLIVLLHLVTFLFLFQFRFLDDNRLTSWQWVFSQTSIFYIVAALATGFIFTTWGMGYRSWTQGSRLFLFSLSYVVGIFLWDTPEAVIDTARYFTQAKYLALYGLVNFLQQWGVSITAWTDLPLLSICYGLLFSIFGEHRLIIQMFNTLLFACSVVLVYSIGARLWNATVGTFAGLALLSMPGLLVQIPMMLVDIPTMFVVTLMIYLLTDILLSDQRKLLTVTAVTLVFVALAKYSTWPMLSILPIMLLCIRPNQYLESGKRIALIVSGAALLMGGWIGLNWNVVEEQLNLLFQYQWPGLARWQEGYLSTFLFQIHPFVTGAAIASVYFAVRNRDRVFLIIAWLPLLSILFGIQRFRYIIPILPLFALMAAYGLYHLRYAGMTQTIACTSAVYGVTIAILAYSPFLQNSAISNLQRAGQYLNRLPADRIEVVTLNFKHTEVNPSVSVPLLDVYTHKSIVYPHSSRHLPPAGIQRSPIRFSWHTESPSYYQELHASKGNASVVVLIREDKNEPIRAQLIEKLNEYNLSSEFLHTDNVFRFQTLIQIYEKSNMPNLPS